MGLPHTTRLLVFVLPVLLAGVAGYGTFVRSIPTQDLALREPAGRIDINHADAATLQLLPGIGPALAEAIIQHRQANGPFTSVEQLEDVHRIGPVIRARLEPWITLGKGSAADQPARRVNGSDPASE